MNVARIPFFSTNGSLKKTRLKILNQKHPETSFSTKYFTIIKGDLGSSIPSPLLYGRFFAFMLWLPVIFCASSFTSSVTKAHVYQFRAWYFNHTMFLIQMFGFRGHVCMVGSSVPWKFEVGNLDNMSWPSSSPSSSFTTRCWYPLTKDWRSAFSIPCVRLRHLTCLNAEPSTSSVLKLIFTCSSPWNFIVINHGFAVDLGLRTFGRPCSSLQMCFWIQSAVASCPVLRLKTKNRSTDFNFSTASRAFWVRVFFSSESFSSWLARSFFAWMTSLPWRTTSLATPCATSYGSCSQAVPDVACKLKALF